MALDLGLARVGTGHEDGSPQGFHGDVRGHGSGMRVLEGVWGDNSGNVGVLACADMFRRLAAMAPPAKTPLRGLQQLLVGVSHLPQLLNACFYT